MNTLVKTLMGLRRVSQADLERETGVSNTAISRFLNGNSDLRSDALVKVLAALGVDTDSVIRREINKALGNQDDIAIGEDIRALLEQAPPITRKTMADTIISTFKNEKDLDTKTRVARIKKYRDSIRTVRRQSC